MGDEGGAIGLALCLTHTGSRPEFNALSIFSPMRNPRFFKLFLVCVLGAGSMPQQARPQGAGVEGRIDGDLDVATALQRLGARMEQGMTLEDFDDYVRHFAVVDLDGDGLHSKTEYIDRGNYMTPQARRGIFQAADNDADEFVSRSEYILNRVITDEAKSIVQAMDDNQDGTVQRTEFVAHAMDDEALAAAVFDALDSDGSGDIVVPEYLRVWGRWARSGRETPENRIAKRESQLRGEEAREGGVARPDTRESIPGTRGLAALLAECDKNGDGRIEPHELLELIPRLDRNHDWVLDREELQSLDSRADRRPTFPSIRPVPPRRAP